MQINVLEYLNRSSIIYKNKTAIIDGEKSYSFEDLSVYSKKIANSIINKVDSIKKPIAVFLPKSYESIASFYGILYSGNIYVPLDVKSPANRIAAILNNMGPTMVITSTELYGALIEIGIEKSNILLLEEIEVSIVSDLVISNRISKMIDTDPAYIIYTSGSTGIPKGVTISHRSIIDYIDWAVECLGFGEKDIIGNQSPFYFDNSTLDIYICVSTGATLCLIPEDIFTFPVKLIDYLKEKSINSIFWVPSVLINIANLKILDNGVLADTLTRVLFAGEVMPNKQLNYWRRNTHKATYVNLYGPTEVTVDCTYYIVDREFEDSESLPIGYPCKNSDILILNEFNNLVQFGEIGELCVRGTSLALGYWKDFDKTNSVFVQNPLNTEYPEKIYRTGDLVYINEYNEIIYVGRKDYQIKHLGYRIELGEIETAVLSIENIYNACVLYDQNKKEIHLFYQSADEIEVRKLRLLLLSKLPKYMIPTKYHHYDNLPMNANGKIDRKKLMESMLVS